MAAIDFTPIVSAFVPDSIASVALSIAGLLAVLYVVCFAVVAVLVTIRGGTVADQVHFLDRLYRESQFKNRYKREQRSRQYREWKKHKGL